MQFVERVPWVPSLGIEYHLGVDGLGLLMVLLSALVVPFAMLASWKIENNPKLYFALMLFLEAGFSARSPRRTSSIGSFIWELGLIPAFFLIKMWGGPQAHQRRLPVFYLHHGRKRGDAAAFLAIYAADRDF